MIAVMNEMDALVQHADPLSLPQTRRSGCGSSYGPSIFGKGKESLEIERTMDESSLPSRAIISRGITMWAKQVTFVELREDTRCIMSSDTKIRRFGLAALWTYN